MYKNNLLIYSFFVFIAIIIGLITIYYKFGKTSEPFTLPPPPPFIIVSDDASEDEVTDRVTKLHNAFSGSQDNLFKNIDLALSDIDKYIINVDDRLRREMHIINNYDNKNDTNNLRTVKNMIRNVHPRLKSIRNKIDNSIDKTLHMIDIILDM